MHFDSTCRWCLYPLALFDKSNKILSLPLFVEFSIDKNNIFFSFPSSYLKRVTPILMFVFISDIFECRIECKNSNDFSIGLWKGLVIFLFENTCGMWRRQRHTIMISVMCTLPMVYMCKLKYSGKMIKSYRFSMTPVKTVESFYVFNNTYRVSLFACKSDSVLHDFFHCFHFVLYAQCVHCALFLPFECCTIWSLNSHPGNLCVQDISVRQMDSLNSIKFRWLGSYLIGDVTQVLIWTFRVYRKLCVHIFGLS